MLLPVTAELPVGGHEVEVPVAVDIRGGDSRDRPARRDQNGASKTSGAVAEQQGHVARVRAGREQIEVAVFVEVAGHRKHGPETGEVGHRAAERAVAVATVELDREASVAAAADRQHEIHDAVLVEVARHQIGRRRLEIDRRQRREGRVAESEKDGQLSVAGAAGDGGQIQDSVAVEVRRHEVRAADRGRVARDFERAVAVPPVDDDSVEADAREIEVPVHVEVGRDQARSGAGQRGGRREGAAVVQDDPDRAFEILAEHRHVVLPVAVEIADRDLRGSEIDGHAPRRGVLAGAEAAEQDDRLFVVVGTREIRQPVGVVVRDRERTAFEQEAPADREGPVGLLEQRNEGAGDGDREIEVAVALPVHRQQRGGPAGAGQRRRRRRLKRPVAVPASEGHHVVVAGREIEVSVIVEIGRGQRGQLVTEGDRDRGPERAVPVAGSDVRVVAPGDLSGDVELAVVVEVADDDARRQSLRGADAGLKRSVAVAQEHVHVARVVIRLNEVEDSVAVEVADRHVRGVVGTGERDRRPERAVAVAELDLDGRAISRRDIEVRVVIEEADHDRKACARGRRDRRSEPARAVSEQDRQSLPGDRQHIRMAVVVEIAGDRSFRCRAQRKARRGSENLSRADFGLGRSRGHRTRQRGRARQEQKEAKSHHSRTLVAERLLRRAADGNSLDALPDRRKGFRPLAAPLRPRFRGQTPHAGGLAGHARCGSSSRGAGESTAFGYRSRVKNGRVRSRPRA